LLAPGESGLSGRELWLAGRVGLIAAIGLTNLIGACVVLVLAEFVIPIPYAGDIGHVRVVDAIAAAAYVAVAVPAGTLAGIRGLIELRRWLCEERPATDREVRLVLQAPLRLFVVQLVLWLGAALMFGLLNAAYIGAPALRVGIVVALTGFVTAACAYLLTERIIRPAAVRALGERAPVGLWLPGVATRAVLAWAIGTGVPLGGLVAVGIVALARHDASPHDLEVAMIALGGTGIAVGLLAVTIAARLTADPIDDVRRAMESIGRGERDVRVPVYDATQIGQLQLGFNHMAAGLEERERIREALGVYVDPDVAERILREGTNLGGEEVEVTVMFIDIRDFTSFAERTEAADVVGALNQLFEKIVPILHEHGGRVDKYIGDGLLAVFGAPRRQEDHAREAFAAACEIARAVADAELKIGIGLNSGTVVAGNVGGGGRLEFSVIGDAVNVAARVEAATRDTGDTILLTDRTRELLGEDVDLVERPGVTLKGKSEAVRLFAPAT
jgi:adenylate cyclase